MHNDQVWIAQYSAPQGGSESIVLFDEKPTAGELDGYKPFGTTLDGLYQLERVGGPTTCQLPLNRTLAAKL